MNLQEAGLPGTAERPALLLPRQPHQPPLYPTLGYRRLSKSSLP